MDNLETKMLQKESSFIATVGAITKDTCSNRTKIALIHREYVKHLVAIDNLVDDAKLRTPPAVAAGTN